MRTFRQFVESMEDIDDMNQYYNGWNNMVHAIKDPNTPDLIEFLKRIVQNIESKGVDDDPHNKGALDAAKKFLKDGEIGNIGAENMMNIGREDPGDTSSGAFSLN